MTNFFLQAVASYRGHNCVLLENEYSVGEVLIIKGIKVVRTSTFGGKQTNTLSENGLAFKECHSFMQMA